MQLPPFEQEHIEQLASALLGARNTPAGGGEAMERSDALAGAEQLAADLRLISEDEFPYMSERYGVQIILGWQEPVLYVQVWDGIQWRTVERIDLGK